MEGLRERDVEMPFLNEQPDVSVELQEIIEVLERDKRESVAEFGLFAREVADHYAARDRRECEEQCRRDAARLEGLRRWIAESEFVATN